MKTKIILCCLLITSMLKAQQPPLSAQEQLEHLADANGIETEKSNDYLQQLDEYRRHPLSINTATSGELGSLHLLTDLQIDQLLRYRRLAGNLVDLHELQAVPGWDPGIIEKLMPFLTVAVPVSLAERLAARLKGNQTFWMRAGTVLQKSKGYLLDSGNRYLGSPVHLMLSYKYQYKNLLYFGVTADKDPGEQFFRGAQSKGFDFYSFHFFLRNMGCIRALAIGDYTVNLGQGLLSWQSDGFGKSGSVLSIKKGAPVLSPYRAAGESGFNRGIGITLGRGRTEAGFWISYKKVSGSIDSGKGSFGSLQPSGYYRTSSEIANRYRIGQWSWGGHLSYNNGPLQFGLNMVGEHLSVPWQKRDQPYNQFAFTGQILFGAGLQYSYTQKNRHWFGELALDRYGHQAVLSGVLMSMDPKIDLSFLYRGLSSKYNGVEGSAFSESSSPVNEQGFYMGMLFRPATSWQISAYADFYRFPWLRYRVNAPSLGHDYLVQMNYQPGKKWLLYLRYRAKYGSLNDEDGVVLAFPEGRLAKNLRVHISDQLSPNLSVKTRVEMVWLQGGKGGKEQGFLVYAEISGRPVRRVRADLRLQYVETGSYDTRLYAYESDVLYSFSIPAYFGKMYRYYLNISIDASRRVSFWARWSESVYPGMESIGSGLDGIAGGRRSEVKLQAVLKF